ncbi:hypothetical protein XELAEV_18006719mg [Xenopus laevis]|uniref:Secreted protein n=1 Tax=Xenopus laevis TaxID=8355 RepID=A0A974I407_XENLA|nr:hypothetical protein XELAEV_18006719mg [Xenopus laevis]
MTNRGMPCFQRTLLANIVWDFCHCALFLATSSDFLNLSFNRTNCKEKLVTAATNSPSVTQIQLSNIATSK